MTTEKGTSGDGSFELLAMIMSKNAADAAFTTNALLDAYQRDSWEWRARFELAEEALIALFEKGYMPTPNAIMDVFFADERAVSRRMDTYRRQGS